MLCSVSKVADDKVAMMFLWLILWTSCVLQLCDVPGYLDRNSHATAVVPHRRPERVQRRLSKEPGEISHGGVITARSLNYRLCENFQVCQNLFGESAPFAEQL